MKKITVECPFHGAATTLQLSDGEYDIAVSEGHCVIVRSARTVRRWNHALCSLHDCRCEQRGEWMFAVYEGHGDGDVSVIIRHHG